MEMKWISIEDRLPEHEKDVDIFTKENGRISDCMYVDPEKYDDEDEKHFYDEINDRAIPLDYVTHWMPLPEPPI